jgi:hypothetical protein
VSERQYTVTFHNATIRLTKRYMHQTLVLTEYELWTIVQDMVQQGLPVGVLVEMVEVERARSVRG